MPASTQTSRDVHNVTISSVRAVEIAVPFAPGHFSATALTTVKSTVSRSLVVIVETDSGVVGATEAPVRPHVYGDSTAALKAAVEGPLARCITGLNPLHTQMIVETMETPTGIEANLVAKAAIDIAIHDVKGKLLGTSVANCLGGGERPNGLALTWLLPLADTDAVLREAEEMAAAGFSGFKVKVGRDLGRDLRLVRALRTELGDEAFIYVDANEGYALRDALRAADAFAESGVAFIEDPCDVSLPRSARAAFARACSVPILGDAGCHTPAQVRNELDDGLIDAVLIKTARTGFVRSSHIVRLAESYGAACLVGTQGEGLLGTLAGWQLACAFPSISGPTEVAFMHKLSDQIAGPLGPEPIQHGRLAYDEQPGLGVKLLDDKLAMYAV
jgi:L-Ala-D/L-Glu epimerase